MLVLTGAEPDYRWHELANDVVALAQHLGVAQWISLGAIPAAVPHTRPVPILGTESRAGLLKGSVLPGPEGVLRVPAAAISVFDISVAKAGIPGGRLLRPDPALRVGAVPGGLDRAAARARAAPRAGARLSGACPRRHA